MTPNAAKRSLCEFAVALMVCGALHYFIVAPTERRVMAVRADVEALDGKQVQAQQLSTTDLAAMVKNAAESFRRVREGSRLVEDQTELLGTLTSLAERAGVTLEQLEPGEIKVRADNARTGTQNDAKEGAPTDRTLDSFMTVSGSFAAVAHFLEALTGSAGYTTVKSVQLDQTDLRGVVRAKVRAQHEAFTTPTHGALAAQLSESTP